VRLELTTPCLKGRCSNRLSYGPSSSQNSKQPAAWFAILVNRENANNSLDYPDFGKKVNLLVVFAMFLFSMSLRALEPQKEQTNKRADTHDHRLQVLHLVPGLRTGDVLGDTNGQ
jgi:hypothetical protein